MASCPNCGEDFKRLDAHQRWCKGASDSSVAVMEKPAEEPRRSLRGQRRYTEADLTPLEQIRMQPMNITGAWAYYLRPEGATIREALITYPNGGVPDLDDKRLQAKYGTNAEYFRERQRQKGFTYLGQTLNEQAMKLLVDTLARNRGDYMLFLEEEIASCEYNRLNNDSQREREIAAKRKAQYKRLLDQARQPFDPDALLAELNDIARAQMLANVDPKVLRVMRAMIGEVNEKMAGLVTHFQRGKQNEVAPELAGISVKSGTRDPAGALVFDEGASVLDN